MGNATDGLLPKLMIVRTKRFALFYSGLRIQMKGVPTEKRYLAYSLDLATGICGLFCIHLGLLNCSNLCYLSMFVFVSSSAMSPDLANVPIGTLDVAHLDHGMCKIPEESIVILCIFSHDGVHRTAIVQRLIRMKQSLLFQQILEICIVKS